MSLDGLQDTLRRIGPVVVAFSGGADSAFLARVAHDTLGRDAVLCATAVSESLAPEEQADCAALAEEWGLRWTPVTTRELERPEYVANDSMRCFHCKAELMTVVSSLEVLLPGTGSVVSLLAVMVLVSTVLLGVLASTL